MIFNIEFVLIVLLSYLLGSIPFSLFFGKLWGVDIRTKGSGNVGAVNAIRSAGKIPGALALFFDVGKGALAIILAKYWLNLADNLMIAIGVSSVIGHAYPVFLKFRGGKCVATSAGVMLVLSPIAILVSLLLYGIAFFCSNKTPFIASTVGTAAFPIFTVWAYHYQPQWYSPLLDLDYNYFLIATIFLFVLILYRHTPNYRQWLSNRRN
jgi:glycerol-3-phosphate acyltransferase PlsY